MNCILRGVRVIDPIARLDAAGQDVWLSDGRIIAIYKHIGEGTLPVIDLTPPPGGQPCVLCPGFIDLHTHLREAPGCDEDAIAETILSGAMAAAAGGFTHIVSMANTVPPMDNPDILKEASFGALSAPVQILVGAALTKGLAGNELVDMAACAASGAAAFTDDGNNSASAKLLSEAIVMASKVDRPVMIHSEDEETVALAAGVRGPVGRCSSRPPAAEAKAVDYGIRAVRHAGVGKLHLQHISTAMAVDMIRKAKEDGVAVTAEATPHHLGMWLPMSHAPEPPSFAKVNPPLRSEADRIAVVQALRDGVIDAVATDHAPHLPSEKGDDYEAAAPGMIGLETALATCLTLGGMGGDWLPVLIERLTVGPYRVLGGGAGLREPRLRIGEAATCIVFDPGEEWVVGKRPMFTSGRNTPLMGTSLRGRVILTLIDGAVVHHDARRLPWPTPGLPVVHV